ncbi:hypothetical protein [Carbonactinospora thermoautotrophica]|uniref:hypothetical protein n=1 Tax=Carbonactinospora thermoautotrophica TaxID=1469144 RepID=UPI003DA9BE73
MGRVGCALDNAVAEALNSTLKVEAIQHFTTREEARQAVEAIQHFTTREEARQAACGEQSPIGYEHGTATLAEAAENEPPGGWQASSSDHQVHVDRAHHNPPRPDRVSRPPATHDRPRLGGATDSRI